MHMQYLEQYHTSDDSNAANAEEGHFGVHACTPARRLAIPPTVWEPAATCSNPGGASLSGMSTVSVAPPEVSGAQTTAIYRGVVLRIACGQPSAARCGPTGAFHLEAACSNA